MIDGGLRRLFREHLPHYHWISIETGGTGRGIPDSEYCCAGDTGWVEFKLTDGWAVPLRPEQVAFALRRSRAGGRVTIAVRRRAAAGPRRGTAVDELWLLRGSLADKARELGLPKFQMPGFGGLPTVLDFPDHPYAIKAFGNGPARWDWAQIDAILRSG